MSVFLSNQDLSRDGLRLSLNNDLGQQQDPVSLTWTVFASDGSLASGVGLPAIKLSPGNFYAPWKTSSKTGTYTITWDIINWPDCSLTKFSETVFIIDPSSYSCFGLKISDYPIDNSKIFVSPSWLSLDDLVLNLKDSNGFYQDAYAIFWSIYNKNGCLIYTKTSAGHQDVGKYFAQFLIGFVGDFYVLWEWQDTADSPLQSTKQYFSTISGSKLSFYQTSDCGPVIVIGYDECCRSSDLSCLENIECHGFSNSSACSGCDVLSSGDCQPPTLPPSLPISPMTQCCSFEIPRTIHLPYGPLPNGGGFTSQSIFNIGTGVRKITFYMKYKMSSPGGYAAFKLMWSNGIEEIQETVLDMDVSNQTASTQSQNLFIQELRGPIPDTNDPIDFVLYVTVPGGATGVRLLAAEKGSPLFPGNLGITITAST